MLFFKPLVLAIVIGFLCIVLQKYIVEAYLSFISPTEQVAALCRSYFDILIWGAPLVLFNYVSLGWLMGQAQVRASVIMQVSSNLLNIILSILFVLVWKLGIEGVAVATLLCQIYGAAVGVFLIAKLGNFNYRILLVKELLDWRTFTEMLKVNFNLMLRTACLLVVNNVMAAVGAGFGTVVLAANAVLLQIKDLMSFLMDGIANGTAIFTGKSIGQKSGEMLDKTLYLTYKWAAVLALLLSGLYFVGNSWMIGLFTNLDAVINTAEEYKFYILLYPAVSFIGLSLYGVFSGATRTAPVRNMMLIASASFYLLQMMLVPCLKNDGLWIAYMIYMVMQSIVLYLYMKCLKSSLIIV